MGGPRLFRSHIHDDQARLNFICDPENAGRRILSDFDAQHRLHGKVRTPAAEDYEEYCDRILSFPGLADWVHLVRQREAASTVPRSGLPGKSHSPARSAILPLSW